MSTKGPAENHLKTGGETLEFQNKIEVTNKVSDACLDTFQAMKLRRKHRYIIFKLGEEEIEVESTGERKSVRTTVYIDFYDGLTNCNCFEQTFEAFKAALPFSDCRFCVYDQDYTTADGRPASKLWFISWFPNNSNTYHKMAYASAKGKFRECIPGVFDTQVSSVEELDLNLGVGKEEEEEDKEFDF